MGKRLIWRESASLVSTGPLTSMLEGAFFDEILRKMHLAGTEPPEEISLLNRFEIMAGGPG